MLVLALNYWLSSWLCFLLSLWSLCSEKHNIVRSFSTGYVKTKSLLQQPLLHQNFFSSVSTVNKSNDDLRCHRIALFGETGSGNDDGGGDLNNDNINSDGYLPPSQTDSILLGVAQAKTSGILAVAALLSQGAYDRAGGDFYAIDGILMLPPGGPIVITVALSSGLYTLWRIQPVLEAVRASVKAQDERRRFEVLDTRDHVDDDDN